jgi:flagellar protein FliO/FliZ
VIAAHTLFALAQAPDLPGSDVTTALRGIVATAVVLGLLGVLAWLLKRGTLVLPGRARAGGMRVETAVALGDRRSLVIVAVEGRRLLLGLTPMQVTLVTELEAPTTAPFSAVLDQSLTAPMEIGR